MASTGDLSFLQNFFDQFGVIVGIVASLLAIFLATNIIGKKIDSVKKEVNRELSNVKNEVTKLDVKMDNIDRDTREIMNLAHELNTRMEVFMTVQNIFDLRKLFKSGERPEREGI